MAQDQRSLNLMRLVAKDQDSDSSLTPSKPSPSTRPVLLGYTYTLFNLDSVPPTMVLGLAFIPIFIATLIYLLLKPISDIISDASSGIGIAASKTALAVEIVLNSLWVGSVGIVSSIVTAISSDSPSHLPGVPTFPTDLSRELFYATTNMTLRIEAQAMGAATMEEHLAAFTGGLVLESVLSRADILGGLSISSADYDGLPVEVRAELSRQLNTLSNKMLSFWSHLVVVHNAAYDFLLGFKRQLDALEGAIEPMLTVPSQSAYDIWIMQWDKSQAIIDKKLWYVVEVVGPAMRLGESLDLDMKHLEDYIMDTKVTLNSGWSVFKRHFVALGILTSKNEDIDVVRHYTKDVLKGLTVVRQSLDSVHRAGPSFKDDLDESFGASPIGMHGTNPTLIRKRLHEYMSRQPKLPAFSPLEELLRDT
ncbi:uncharacterized protein EV420DRAFT_1644269 [Desarmillaria tabescens]|uniref:Uncharacterized protein n=1 Tax=Armillaria tabescens TaxID=1929756 RepID=A0AA39N402_ARMTA|nr:uncharacterized protein EV420DRAFT_1644269 [Desarmillaria tabescens]KAK0457112.1 hypothetical protein EV420DRAFT_1644269 [Desarmillaria tabescens]